MSTRNFPFSKEFKDALDKEVARQVEKEIIGYEEREEFLERLNKAVRECLSDMSVMIRYYRKHEEGQALRVIIGPDDERAIDTFVEFDLNALVKEFIEEYEFDYDAITWFAAKFAKINSMVRKAERAEKKRKLIEWCAQREDNDSHDKG